MVWKPCYILEYDHYTRKYLIQWMFNKRKKEVTRLNLLFDNETVENGDKRLQKAIKKRE